MDMECGNGNEDVGRKAVSFLAPQYVMLSLAPIVPPSTMGRLLEAVEVQNREVIKSGKDEPGVADRVLQSGVSKGVNILKLAVLVISKKLVTTVAAPRCCKKVIVPLLSSVLLPKRVQSPEF